jgi:two-component system, NarL family, sensor kinase
MQYSRELVILLIVSTTIIILILTLISMVLLYANQRRKMLFQQNIATLKSQYEKDLLNTQLEIQEQTLENISREIHDNIGLSLTLAKLNLTTLSKEPQASPSEKIAESTELISQAISDLSTISHGLNSDVIRTNGLIKALEEETGRIRKISKVNAMVIASGHTVFLRDQQELLLFRICQEALNNVLKYASAKQAIVRLHYERTELSLTISDDGGGFSDGTASRNGSGILNMRARAQLLGGTFCVSSSTLGTIIQVKLPINK